mmetsp:Transcript_34862/g.75560  ORF Transcript_34862/g.75560 Transcript_34862/m.75560 type:complete len:1356 (+) Transcript_34862:124-4191(+)
MVTCRRKELLCLNAKDSSARTGISRNAMTMLVAASASALRAVTVAAVASRQLSRTHSLRRPFADKSSCSTSAFLSQATRPYHSAFASSKRRDPLLAVRMNHKAALASAPGSSLPFEVTSRFEPSGDQPQAIEKLIKNIEEGDRFSVLRGVTGSGKTYVLGHTIARLNRPTLVICHNKTLAAQVARELKSFLGNNAVELFVSYYNHYTPESYAEATGTYIAKKSSVNDEIDALRHRATRALLERRDVVIVASVSCIYGLGLPREYLDASISVSVANSSNGSGVATSDALVAKLDAMLYDHVEDGDLLRGTYEISDDVSGKAIVTLWPPHEKMPIRVAFGTHRCGEQGILSIYQATNDASLTELEHFRIFPAKHHVTSQDKLGDACVAIEDELASRVEELNSSGKYVESQRLQQRVMNDLLMLRETGHCQGTENYSRHLAGRRAGEAPDTLLNYMKFAGDQEAGERGGDWLLVIDESHVTVPQLRAMYHGDRARKEKLVKHGFRLPSALDNRPLQEHEFWEEVSQAVLVSATPSKRDLERAEREPVDMVIRPTHVCDPVCYVRPKDEQLEDLLKEVRHRAKRKERVLAVALTKRDAEDLASFLIDHGVRADYIHSGLTTVERADALKSLQSGDIDCLVGVNLLREGLDLPQVSLVAILNADSEGFLRCETSLLQTIGRAARNANGEAVLYADRVTKSMQACLDETERRRKQQLAHNKENNVESKSTNGSNTLSIFDLLRDESDVESYGGREGDSNKKRIAPMQLVPSSPSVHKRNHLKRANGDIFMTEHIPSKSGVYFWKDANGSILYIGKAKKLRSRVRSYLSPGAKHSLRIRTMLEKAETVEFILTPSDRDALILESNLIKQHQPPYNVLLKDDETYPYICASIGDRYPRFFPVPRRLESAESSRYRYYGPYPHYSEINSILDSIERKYDLRVKSFAARYGSGSGAEYKQEFTKALKEVFEAPAADKNCSVLAKREEFEEAGLLIGSDYNHCRDVVAIEPHPNDETRAAVVYILQLRDGTVAGRFSYAATLQAGLKSVDSLSDTIHTILERHYQSAGEGIPGKKSFFPDEILTEYPVNDMKTLKQSIRSSRRQAEPNRKGAIQIRTPNKRGPKVRSDERAMIFAKDNAKQVAMARIIRDEVGALESSIDGTATKELARLLSLEKEPHRIECYDISHTQGMATVASRVVFIDGKPAKHLYRTFNLKTVQGVDDYKSLEEVLERRFRRMSSSNEDNDNGMNAAAGSGNGEAWSVPDLVVIDGGRGQLSAAIKGMTKANVIPRHTAPGAPLASASHTKRDTSVQVCALAKNEEKLFIPGRSSAVNHGAPDTPALLLLRAIRDESHRFALKAHRRRRSL